MIKLSGSGITTWSTSFSHPEQSSGVYVTYNLNHNKGKIPFSYSIRHSQDSYDRVTTLDYAASVQGMYLLAGLNTMRLDITRLGPGTRTVYVDLYFLN